ncbi:phenylalanyl-tRNA synthetase alpha chain [Capronia epimyces CBS 606.96]|uniref:Phenylalanine--tRNA ligase, mitochondrial n=1 Tax=Capronia epimyces CBS 606.96 TaxID=1182542 RepID=W9YK35_9EURO|nr:phenylalanyl-tRNA synthetase alpha chain [Capronia epimyces CBS 606.96]EXJ82629.1 phenylalanyl-tRNA synthetase alpha chain [Capronia epimyces CBS 606.96]
MQLLKTGAFVRAARSARITVPKAPVPVPACVRPRLVQSRWSSSQATAEVPRPFPEQSVEISREVDPTKTAPESKDEPDQEHLKQKLKELAHGKKAVNGHLAGVNILGNPYIFDATTNVPDSILQLVGRNLYRSPDHPIAITKALIESCFPKPTYNHFTVADPVVTTHENFDVLGFPKDHPGRSRTDTYYVNTTHLLRTHTSAHQHAAFQSLVNDEAKGYTVCADVYRRDSIDKSHFPVFHQMEGARVWDLPVSADSRYEAQLRRKEIIEKDVYNLPTTRLAVKDPVTNFHKGSNAAQPEHDVEEVKLVVAHLMRSLEYLVNGVFEASREMMPPWQRDKMGPLHARWIEAYFPFTSPSFELEVLWNGEWLELLGCGVVQQPILNNAGLKNSIGWAWGVGIERIAMLLFGIPDIRLFWSQDKRFLQQFKCGHIKKFEPFSKYPECYKDIAFWINSSPAAASPIGVESSSGVAAAAGGDARKASPAETQPAAFHENDIMEVVRDVAGSLVEDVQLVDEFLHPTTGRKSLCYRINYRSLERTLTNEEVNDLHSQVAAKMKSLFNIELR